MVCFSPVGFGVLLTFGAFALCRSRLGNCGEISVRVRVRVSAALQGTFSVVTH